MTTGEVEQRRRTVTAGGKVTDDVDDAAPERGSYYRATPTEGDAALRVLWELSLEAAGIGTFDWDLRTGRLRVSVWWPGGRAVRWAEPVDG